MRDKPRGHLASICRYWAGRKSWPSVCSRTSLSTFYFVGTSIYTSKPLSVVPVAGRFLTSEGPRLTWLYSNYLWVFSVVPVLDFQSPVTHSLTPLSLSFSLPLSPSLSLSLPYQKGLPTFALNVLSYLYPFCYWQTFNFHKMDSSITYSLISLSLPPFLSSFLPSLLSFWDRIPLCRWGWSPIHRYPPPSVSRVSGLKCAPLWGHHNLLSLSSSAQ